MTSRHGTQGNRITVLAAGVFQVVPHLRTLQVRIGKETKKTLMFTF